MVRTSSNNNGGDSDISFNIEMRRQSNPLLPHGAEIGTLCELILDHRRATGDQSLALQDSTTTIRLSSASVLKGC